MSLLSCRPVEVPAIAIDSFRAACGVTFLVYFAEQWLDTLPLYDLGLLGSPASQWMALRGVLALGAGAALGLVLGALPRTCSLAVLACCSWLKPSVGLVHGLGDDVLRALAFWLVLLPIGRTLRAYELWRRPSVWNEQRGLGVPASTTWLMLAGATGLLCALALFIARTHGPVHWLLAGLPAFALVKRVRSLRWAALLAQPSLVWVLTRPLHAPFATTALLLVTPLFQVPFRRAERAVFDLPTCIASLVCVTAVIWTIGRVAPLASLTGPSGRLLDDLGLLLSSIPDEVSLAPRSSPVRMYDGAGRPAKSPMSLGDNLRMRRLVLLMAESAPRAHRLRVAFSRLVCGDRSGLHGTVELRIGEVVAARFECLGAGEARQLTRESPAVTGIPDARQMLAMHDARFPALPDIRGYAGAGRCRACHEEQYTRWQASPHASSAASIDRASVKGNFSTAPDAIRSSRADVALVLGAGTREQAYAVRNGTGHYELLPAMWSDRAASWIPMHSLYPDTALTLDAAENGCIGCHLAPTAEIGVDCESCHGPLLEHAVHRERGEPESLRDSNAKREMCQACHGGHLPYRALDSARAQGFADFATGLDRPALRADGGALLPNREFESFASSACHMRDATCSTCHAVHTSEVDATHASRCASCHSGEVASASEHSHHPERVKCVDCHMSRGWAQDDAGSGRLQTNHAISIPRPRETMELGVPNACGTCHVQEGPAWALQALERWAQRGALDTRTSVGTFARAKDGHTDQAPALVQVLAMRDRDPLLLASALWLLANQEPDSRWVPALEPWSRHAMPELRSAAIAALAHHDRERAAYWHDIAEKDSHPFVRMFALEARLISGGATETEFRAYLRDLLGHASAGGVAALVGLAQLRLQQGEPEEAVALLARAARDASESQRRRFAIDETLVHIQNDWDASAVVRPRER